MLWNSLSIECFPLTYDQTGFKSRINRHLLSVGSFYRDFLYALIFLCFFFLVTWCCSVLHGRAYFKKKKHLGIRHFIKSALYLKKYFFLIWIKSVKNNFWLGWISPPPARLPCSSAFLSNKGAFSLKQKALFQEQF